MHPTQSNLPHWLAATYLPNIGPRTILTWLTHFHHIENLFTSPQQALQSAGIPTAHITSLSNPNWAAVERDLAWAAHPNHHLLTLDDPAYPAQLKEIPDPPLVLYLLGDPTILQTKQIAIVGARNATITGLKTAEHFAHHLASAGLTITSGLARGIDSSSHRGALSAHGLTIAVAGTGLEHIYPTSNQDLANEIAANKGAIVSEFPLTMRPHAQNFPRRNRIISGLSIGILVVEAALKSGSLITAKHALEHGREIFSIPGSIHNPLARGCHHLIRQGAKLVETVTDILDELVAHQLPLPFTTPSANLKQTAPIKNTPERIIFDQIDHETTPIEVIISRSGLTAGEVSSILLTLEVNGCIQSVPGGYLRSLR